MSQSELLPVYVGTRTSLGRSEGLYQFFFDVRNGSCQNCILVAKTKDPSFVAIDLHRPNLFAVEASSIGKVRAYSIQPDGTLELVNEASSGGSGPAYVQLDYTGEWLACANYFSGSVAICRVLDHGGLTEPMEIVQHTGHGPNQFRQEGPHAHSAYFTTDNTQLYVCDLGLDAVKVYDFDRATGRLMLSTTLQAPEGSGPRHLAFARGRVYVLNELHSSISVFENGQRLETVSALPPMFVGESTAAEIIIDRTQTFAYCSNRGADTVAVFRLSDRIQKVADVKVARTPRNIVLSPDGRFLLVASQDDDIIETYQVDAQDGLLRSIGQPLNVPTPICLRFVRRRSLASNPR